MSGLTSCDLMSNREMDLYDHASLKVAGGVHLFYFIKKIYFSKLSEKKNIDASVLLKHFMVLI